MGKWKLTHRFDKIVQHLDRQAEQIVAATASDIKWEAKRLVPAPGQSRGYALGSLRKSIHIQTHKRHEYAAAIVDAELVPGARVLVRGQSLPPVLPSGPYPHRYAAIIDVPLSYGNLIHDGFYHIRANRWITGTTFLYSAANEHRDLFRQRVIAMLKGLENVAIMKGLALPEPRQKRTFGSDDEARDYYNSLARASGNAQVAEAQMLERDRAVASLGERGGRAGMELGEAHEAYDLRIEDLINRDELW
jgi:hypothetical protein